MSDPSKGIVGAFTDGSRERKDERPLEAEGHGVLLLRLLVRPGEPLTGTVGLAHQPTGIPFQGWIDFMAAVNRLRSDDVVLRP